MCKTIKVYRAGVHVGEEKIIFGNQASGMVTLSGCNLSCDYCYTPETSVDQIGEDLSPAQFLGILESLVKKGAQNINLITPTHLWDAIEPVLYDFKRRYGERVPIVLKLGGFETKNVALRMSSVADVLVPDFKVATAHVGVRLSLPSRYPVTAKEALRLWMRTHGTPVYHSDGRIRHGLLVRHLLIPGYEEEALNVIRTLEDIGYRGAFNLMTYFIDREKRTIRRSNDRDIGRLIQASIDGGLVLLLDGRMVKGFAKGFEGSDYGQEVSASIQ